MPSRSATPQGMQHADSFGYEKRDANAKGIFLSVAGIFLTLVIIDVIVHFIVKDFKQSPTPGDRYSGSVRQTQAAANRPPFPKLQISAAADLSHFRKEEANELTTYGWIDKTAGVVRIPVDRAMELVLQRGLPTREPGQQGKAGASSYEMQQQRPNARQPEIMGSDR